MARRVLIDLNGVALAEGGVRTMDHFIVSCEFRGKRRDTVEVPVSISRMIDDGVDVTSMLACKRAERKAAENFGGSLSDWFAWKVIIDTE